jgi:hypothetical protein
MNVKLLRKVKKHILEEPKRLFMRTYVFKKSYEGEKLRTCMGKKRDFARCGTAACIAGWAVLLSKKGDTVNLVTGREALELPDIETALRLFEPSSWPDKFQDGLDDDGTIKTARVAAARIEHFIKTKGAE